MTPQERLALALQYQKQRDLGSALPSTPAENAARPVQEPEQSWLDKLSEVASGFGYRKAQDLEGLAQAAMHPVDTLHSLAVGVGKAMDNPSAAAQAAWQGLKQSASEAVSNPYNLGSAVAGMTSFNPRKIAAMLESPAVREIVAYHGTPHRFEPTEANPLGEFDASKIGTGEGAQAYGHGVYLAESPDVAKGYKQRLSSSSYSKDSVLIDSGLIWHKAADAASKIGKLHPDNAGEISSQIMDWVDAGRKPETFLKFNAVSSKLKPAYEAALQEYAGAIKNRGSLYHADLPDEMIDRMLDWDKPLSEQPKQIRDAINKTKTLLPANAMADLDNDLSLLYGKNVTPNQFLNTWEALSGSTGSGEAALRQAGIPGIKYLDAGSRGATGTGTRNFVVFPGEEKKVKILERNGEKAPPQKIADALAGMPSQKDVQIDLYPAGNRKNTLNLARIVVDPNKRKQGLGTKAMQEIIDNADAEGQTITLSPSIDFGATSINRLKDFYKQFGFVENKGRNKDFTISESMYRIPKKPENK